ncbi:CLUMA_CG016128, isoform A [Clunio marinus]|uniref:CLUMA_CG016128, isoform A n=1 Tax=Clunio marinus TaxID=568069 RepID=A0A1J1ISK5_9DIPT|nr:CLUMA_CG016128, isoform A [Clunio marinus]
METDKISKAYHQRSHSKANDKESRFLKELFDVNSELMSAKSSEKIFSCYERRSEIYLRMKQYSKCMRNINAARENGTSTNILNMKKECLELIKTDYEIHPKKLDFFELSHSRNKRNPSLAECLKLCVNDKYGRHIVTTKRLTPGDFVLIDKPFYKSLDKNFSCSRCVNCLKCNLFDLDPCKSCASVMFCSKVCEDNAWEEFHKFECSTIKKYTQDDGFLMMIQRTLFKIMKIYESVDNLGKLLKNDLKSETIFDLDVSKGSRKQHEKKFVDVCFSLEFSTPTDQEKSFAKSFVNYHPYIRQIWQTQSQKNILIEFVIRVIGILNRNSFTMHWNSSWISDGDATGCAVLPSASFINHSCSPNLHWICIDDEIIFIVRKPIEVNEQLFICYQ